MTLLDLLVKIGVDDKATSRIASISSAIKGGLSAAAKVGGAAMLAISGAVMAFGKSAVDASMAFDSSMSQVAATMGYTSDEINDMTTKAGQDFAMLRDFAQQMGASTAFSASQAADALNYMALAGYDAETSMSMLPTVLNLAAAGSIDLASASDMVTDAASALNLGIKETTVMVDQMAAASSKSNTSVQQLGEAFLTVGATAANLQGGTQELATVLGVLADNGIKGAEGGTHLRNIILSLTNPTSEAARILDELGVSVYDADGNMRSLVDIIMDLQAGMEGMDQASKDAIVSGLFNRADMASVNALLATTSGRYDELTVAIGDSAGAAERMAAVQLDNLQGDITIFKSALEGVQIALSDQITPALREFVQLGTDGLSELTTAIQNIGEDGGFENVAEVVGNLVADIVGKAGEMIPAFVGVVTQIGISVTEKIPELVGVIVPAIIEATPLILAAGIQMLGGLVQAVVDSLPTLLEAVTQMVNDLADNIEENGPEMQQAFFDVLTTLLNTIVEYGPELLAALARVIGDLVLSVANAAGDMLRSAGEFIGGFISGSDEKYADLRKWFADLPGKLVNALGDVGSILWDAGRSILTGFWDGLKSVWSGITDWVSGIAGTIASLKGPLPYDRKVLVENGLALMSGLQRGLQRGFEDEVEPYISALAGEIEDGMSFSPSLAYSAAGSGYGQVVNNYYIDGNAVDADPQLAEALRTVAQAVSSRNRKGTVKR